MSEIKEESEVDRKEGEEQTAQYILGPGLRREGSEVYVMTSGVLKCRNAGRYCRPFCVHKTLNKLYALISKY